MKDLIEYLKEYGYPDEHACKVSMAYYRDGINAAVHIYSWADDKSHDYTGELRSVIKIWEKQVVKLDCSYPVPRIIVV